jgi:hypothetical protein
MIDQEVEVIKRKNIHKNKEMIMIMINLRIKEIDLFRNRDKKINKKIS